MKLDDFSKIQIATFGIQYLCHSLSSSSMMDFVKPTTEDNSKMASDMFQKVLDVRRNLETIYEDLFNYYNATNSICAIDERILKVPSEILLRKMDDTEKSYEPYY